MPARPTDRASAPATELDPPVETIRTARLELVSMTVPFMRSLVARDFATASLEIGAVVPPTLVNDLDDFLRFRLAQLALDPSIRRWLGRAIVLAGVGVPGDRQVIGSIGFHGPPDADQRLEIGYGIEPSFRRQGYAREAIAALLDWAAAQGIHRFIASIAPTNEPSLRLAAGFGFVQVGTQMDEIDGLELVHETTWPRRT